MAAIRNNGGVPPATAQTNRKARNSHPALSSIGHHSAAPPRAGLHAEPRSPAPPSLPDYPPPGSGSGGSDMAAARAGLEILGRDRRRDSGDSHGQARLSRELSPPLGRSAPHAGSRGAAPGHKHLSGGSLGSFGPGGFFETGGDEGLDGGGLEGGLEDEDEDDRHSGGALGGLQGGDSSHSSSGNGHASRHQGHMAAPPGLPRKEAPPQGGGGPGSPGEPRSAGEADEDTGRFHQLTRFSSDEDPVNHRFDTPPTIDACSSPLERCLAELSELCRRGEIR